MLLDLGTSEQATEGISFFYPAAAARAYRCGGHFGVNVYPRGMLLPGIIFRQGKISPFYDVQTYLPRDCCHYDVEQVSTKVPAFGQGLDIYAVSPLAELLSHERDVGRDGLS